VLSAVLGSPGFLYHKGKFSKKFCIQLDGALCCPNQPESSSNVIKFVVQEGLPSAFCLNSVTQLQTAVIWRINHCIFKGFIFFLQIWHSANLGLLGSRTPCQLFYQAALAVASHTLRRASLPWPWEEGAARHLWQLGEDKAAGREAQLQNG